MEIPTPSPPPVVIFFLLGADFFFFFFGKFCKFQLLTRVKRINVLFSLMWTKILQQFDLEAAIWSCFALLSYICQGEWSTVTNVHDNMTDDLNAFNFS